MGVEHGNLVGVLPFPSFYPENVRSLSLFMLSHAQLMIMAICDL